MYYEYKCPECGYSETVQHAMKTVAELDDQERKLIECPDTTCNRYGEPMSRDYGSIQLGGASGGTFKTEKQLLKDKQAERKLRSKRHFKHEVLPTLDETPKIKKHFNDKFKDI